MIGIHGALVFRLLLPLLAADSGPQTVAVFEPKADGFKSIRIPAVVVTNKGTVLAFAGDGPRMRTRPGTESS